MMLKRFFERTDFDLQDVGPLVEAAFEVADALTAKDTDATRAAFLRFFGLLAEATPTTFDDWLVERLRDAGIDDDTIEPFKPERIQ